MTEDQNTCNQVVTKLANSQEFTEIAQALDTGLQSGMGVLQLLMDNPMLMGMLLGGAGTTWVRGKILRNKKRSTLKENINPQRKSPLAHTPQLVEDTHRCCNQTDKHHEAS